MNLTHIYLTNIHKTGKITHNNAFCMQHYYSWYHVSLVLTNSLSVSSLLIELSITLRCTSTIFEVEPWPEYQMKSL